MKIENLTTDDIPLLRCFHQSVHEQFAQKIEKAKKGTLEDVFRLACDIYNLESPNTNQMTVKSTPVIVNQSGGKRLTTYARDLNRALVVSLAEHAARQGHVKSAFMAGWQYYVGHGRDENKLFGERLLRLAAREGNESAAEYLETIQRPPVKQEVMRDTSPTAFRRFTP